MNTSESRVYSQLNGSGQFAWNYDEFKDIHLRARLAFRAESAGKAGIFCGSLFCCLNYDSQAVELWNGSTKLGSYSQSIQQTPTAILRTDPTTYTIEMRIRGSTVRVYSGASNTLRFTATVSGFSGGIAGYQSDNRTICELLRMGDADEFSILYYQDVDSLVYWANQAANHWSLRGIAILVARTGRPPIMGGFAETDRHLITS